MASCVIQNDGNSKNNDPNEDNASPGGSSGSNASTPFCITKPSRFNLEFITTGLSFTSHNESDMKISFGRTDLYNEYVSVVEYLENDQFYGVCSVRLEHEVYQTKWCPSNPRLLAVASNKLNIYEYRNRQLHFVKNLLAKEQHNPIISIDWNRRDSRNITATRKDGSFHVLLLEYDSSSIVIRRELFSSYPFLSDPDCGGVRFGKGLIGNCLIAIDKNKELQIFNANWKISHKLICDHDILEVQCSKQDSYIALRCPRQICLYDLRSHRMLLNAYKDFRPDETARCFSWSSHLPAIYIGTSRGGIIKWRTDQNIAERHENSEKAPVQSIHSPGIKPNLSFSTSIERGMPQATCIEVHSIG